MDEETKLENENQEPKKKSLWGRIFGDPLVILDE